MTFKEELKYKYFIRRIAMDGKGNDDKKGKVVSSIENYPIINKKNKDNKFLYYLKRLLNIFPLFRFQRKTKIAYVTLLRPSNSGIADWAEELLPHLKEFFDIDIYITGLPSEVSNDSLKKSFKIYSINDYNRLCKKYTFSIFQMGNNLQHKQIIECFMRYGGILELHDVALHYYLADQTVPQEMDKYYDILRYCHGESAVNEAKRAFAGESPVLWEKSLKYTVIKHYVDRAEAVIVHSDFAKQVVKGIAPSKRVYVIPLFCSEISSTPAVDYYSSRKKIGIKNELMMSTFGYITDSKRIIPLLRQVAKLKNTIQKDFCFYIVGEVHIPNLQDIVEELQIQDYVRITGKVPLDSFNSYIKASDLCFNLRYPTQGETSAALLRIIGYGKPVVVTDIGSFHEFSEENIYKINYGKKEGNDIFNIMTYFVKTFKGYSEERANNIISYAKKNYDIDVVAKMYFEYLQLGKNPDTFFDTILDIIMRYYPYEQGIVSKIVSCDTFDISNDMEKLSLALSNDLDSKDFIHIYNLGSLLSFSEEQGATGNKYIIKGFSGAEKTHTWTNGTTAEIGFIFDNICDVLEIAIEYLTFDGKQPVKIYANNLIIADYVANGAENKSFTIPKGTIGENMELRIRFELPGAHTPSSIGMGNDLRKLALAIKSIVIRNKQN